MNKFLLIAISSLLVFGLLGLFTSVDIRISNYAINLITVAEDAGILMMLINGTFVGTRLFKAAAFFFGLIVLGFLFKILHLSGADELLTVPFFFVFCLYVAHFVNKKAKRRIDFLKVLVLLAFLIQPPLVMLHIVSYETTEIIQWVVTILFWFTFFDFLYGLCKDGVLLKRSPGAVKDDGVE